MKTRFTCLRESWRTPTSPYEANERGTNAVVDLFDVIERVLGDGGD
jgi:hypothetical protein